MTLSVDLRDKGPESEEGIGECDNTGWVLGVVVVLFGTVPRVDEVFCNDGGRYVEMSTGVENVCRLDGTIMSFLGGGGGPISERITLAVLLRSTERR